MSPRQGAALTVVVLALTGCAPDEGRAGAPVPEPRAQGFVQAAGRGLAVDGEPLRLEAVNSSNAFCADVDGSGLLDSPHHGVRLVLDRHVPIGGHWLDRGDDEYSSELWSDAGLRQQNAGLWRELADR